MMNKPTTKMIHEEAKETPVIAECDVLVVGGGVAGLAAAVAAARSGASVLMIESQGFLGGTSTARLMNNFGAYDPQVIGGVINEFIARLEALKSASRLFNPNLGSYSVIFDPEIFKYVALQLLHEAGANLLLYTSVVQPIVDNGKLGGVIVENKSGRGAVLAKVTVDATGDGDVAALAGAPYQKGSAVNQKTQAMTLMFQVGNVDIYKFLKYVQEHEDEFREVAIDESQTPPQIMVGGFEKELAKAYQKGEISYAHEIIFVDGHINNGELITINATHILDVDGTNAFDLSRAHMQGIEQVISTVGFLNKYVQGFENCRLRNVANSIGVRDTRRITGEYILTQEDIVGGKRFADVIARNSAPMDIHSPVDGKQEWIHTLPHDIPYRCLVPLKVENVLTAGRCISATHEAFASIRFQPCSMATGQAAGVAAALSAQTGIPPRQLEVAKIQAILKKQGAIL